MATKAPDQIVEVHTALTEQSPKIAQPTETNEVRSTVGPGDPAPPRNANQYRANKRVVLPVWWSEDAKNKWWAEQEERGRFKQENKP